MYTMGNDRRRIIMEIEWWSICCSAPPLYGVEELEDMDTIGICMDCKEHVSFEQGDSNE